MVLGARGQKGMSTSLSLHVCGKSNQRIAGGWMLVADSSDVGQDAQRCLQVLTSGVARKLCRMKRLTCRS